MKLYLRLWPWCATLYLTSTVWRRFVGLDSECFSRLFASASFSLENFSELVGASKASFVGCALSKSYNDMVTFKLCFIFWFVIIRGATLKLSRVYWHILHSHTALDFSITKSISMKNESEIKSARVREELRKARHWNGNPPLLLLWLLSKTWLFWRLRLELSSLSR